MEKISIRVADILLKKEYIEHSKYSIYQYGIQMMLEVGCSFITSAIICCFWGKIIEGLIFFGIFIPLRSYLGGFHMKSYGACFICSCVTLVSILGLSTFYIASYISWTILGLSATFVYLQAKREKQQDEDGRYFYPKICIIIVVLLIIAVIFSLLNFSSELFVLACTNALVAVSKLFERKIG